MEAQKTPNNPNNESIPEIKAKQRYHSFGCQTTSHSNSVSPSLKWDNSSIDFKERLLSSNLITVYENIDLCLPQSKHERNISYLDSKHIQHYILSLRSFLGMM